MERRVPIVLVIDHHPLARTRMAGTLRGCGCSAIASADAADALDTFRAHHEDIALIVADDRLPRMDGPRLAQAVRDIDSHVPLVILGSVPRDARIAAYESLPAVVVLAKPFTPEALVATVQQALATARAAANMVARSAFPGPPTVAPVPVASPAPRVDTPPPTFAWPPRPEDLAAIEVVDAHTLEVIPLDFEPPRPGLVKVGPADILSAVTVGPRSLPAIVGNQALRTVGAPQPWHSRRVLAAAAAAAFGVAFTTLLEMQDRSAPQRATVSTPTVSTRSGSTAAGSTAAGSTTGSTATRSTTTAATATRASDTRALVAAVPASELLGPTRLVRAQRVRTRAVARAVIAPPVDLPPRVPVVLTASRPTVTPAPSPRLRGEGRGEGSPATAARTLPPRGAASIPALARAPAPAEPTRAAGPAVTAAALTLSTAEAPHSTALESRPADARMTTGREAYGGSGGGAEQQIYATLEQYERAYERLDVKAAHAVWPSLDTRALSRAFGGLKAQELEFRRCQLDVHTREATAVCGGRATYVPRVGHQTRRTESREWTFRFEKVDQNWLIVKAEAR